MRGGKGKAMSGDRGEDEFGDAVEGAGIRLQHGIQSVEVGMRLVAALAASGKAMNLKALALAAGMPPAKAHRYLVSLGRCCLVEQDPLTGRYDLGRFALEVGLSALGRLDPQRVAQTALADLRDEIDETICLTVWGNRGATVVHWEESSHPITVNVRVGSVLPLLHSASGRCFLAYMPERETAAALAEALAVTPMADREVEALREEVRRQGMARTTGNLLPGVSALACPVFDHAGRVPFVIAALGSSIAFNADPDGPTGQALRRTAEHLSRRLGCSG